MEDQEALAFEELSRLSVSESTDSIVSSLKKENLNIVFVGHVDAGKSTIGGHILFLTGMVDKRTLEKYEKESKELNRESWYLSWALDTSTEERAKVQKDGALISNSHCLFGL
jgi:peptide chain release factor subunit 3